MSRQTGFTLMEVLVTLVVVGMVYAAFAQGLRFGLHGRTQQKALRGESWALADGWQAARQALAGMEPGSRARPGAFAAAAGRLAFTTALPVAPLPDRGRVDAVLQVDDRHRLMLRWVSRAAPAVSGERVLADGVARVTLGFRRAGMAGAWQSDWTGPGLPGLVRLDVAWLDPARRPWPPLVAGPAIVKAAD